MAESTNRDSQDESADLTPETEGGQTASSRSGAPVKRKRTAAPVKKSKPTPKHGEKAESVKRTGPVEFVKQSIEQLRKVVWPSSEATRQYFIVVLVFVLFIMTFVAGLDYIFGIGLLALLGG